jgi:SAM-dependent methyltransferase
MTYNNYFQLRNIHKDFYDGFEIPNYLSDLIRDKKIKKILDYGCGTGQLVGALKKKDFEVYGMDSSDEAIKIGKKNNVDIIKINNLEFDKLEYEKSFDLIIISHVLEHQKKENMGIFLKNLKYMLKENKYLLTIVPNAQSFTGVYWRYEDFTHEYLFTSGSLNYLLKDNGFEEIKFLDIYATSKINPLFKVIRYSTIKIYEILNSIFLKITGNSYHITSKNIFTYEIKCLSKKTKY